MACGFQVTAAGQCGGAGGDVPHKQIDCAVRVSRREGGGTAAEKDIPAIRRYCRGGGFEISGEGPKGVDTEQCCCASLQVTQKHVCNLIVVVCHQIARRAFKHDKTAVGTDAGGDGSAIAAARTCRVRAHQDRFCQ